SVRRKNSSKAGQRGLPPLLEFGAFSAGLPPKSERGRYSAPARPVAEQIRPAPSEGSSTFLQSVAPWVDRMIGPRPAPALAWCRQSRRHADACAARRATPAEALGRSDRLTGLSGWDHTDAAGRSC